MSDNVIQEGNVVGNFKTLIVCARIKELIVSGEVHSVRIDSSIYNLSVNGLIERVCFERQPESVYSKWQKGIPQIDMSDLEAKPQEIEVWLEDDCWPRKKHLIRLQIHRDHIGIWPDGYGCNSNDGGEGPPDISPPARIEVLGGEPFIAMGMHANTSDVECSDFKRCKLDRLGVIDTLEEELAGDKEWFSNTVRRLLSDWDGPETVEWMHKTIDDLVAKVEISPKPNTEPWVASRWEVSKSGSHWLICLEGSPYAITMVHSEELANLIVNEHNDALMEKGTDMMSYEAALDKIKDEIDGGSPADSKPLITEEGQ